MRFHQEVYRLYREEVIRRIGEEQFEIARRKMRTMNHRHVLETLSVLGFLSQEESYEIIREITGRLGLENVIPVNVANLILEENSVYLYHGGRKLEVIPTFFPLETSSPQALLTLEEYDSIERLLKLSREERTVRVEYTPKELVARALQSEASDFHLIPKDDGYHVFFRVHGVLVEQKDMMLSLEEGQAFLSLLLNEAARETKGQFNPDERKVYQDARISYDDLGCEVRLAYIPDGRTLEHGEVVGRLIRKTKIKSGENLRKVLKRLGYYDEDIEPWERIVNMKGVLVMVSGQTNSGKTTLITHVLSVIKERKIETVEDPVEYEISSANAVHHQIYEPKEESLRMDFVRYVKGFKRADPDVIFVGELREGSPGLMESVISAAYAGQLIFATVHISSAFEIYDFLEMRFATGNLTPENIRHFAIDKIVISFNQALIPRLCPECKVPVKLKFTRDELYYTRLSEDEKEDLLALEGKEVFVRGKGCKACRGLGYVGRLPVYEYFVPNEELKSKLRDTKMPPADIKKYVLSNRKKIKAVTKYEVFRRRLLEGEIEPSAVFLL